MEQDEKLREDLEKALALIHQAWELMSGIVYKMQKLAPKEPEPILEEQPWQE